MSRDQRPPSRRARRRLKATRLKTISAVVAAVVVVAVLVAVVAVGVAYFVRDREQAGVESTGSAARRPTVVIDKGSGVAMVQLPGPTWELKGPDGESLDKPQPEKTPWEFIEQTVAEHIANPLPHGQSYFSQPLDDYAPIDGVEGSVVQVARDQFGRPVTIYQTGVAESLAPEGYLYDWIPRTPIDCAAQPVAVSIQRESNGSWWMISSAGPSSPLSISDPADQLYAPSPEGSALSYANMVLRSQAGRGIRDVFLPADAYKITECSPTTVAGQVAFPVSGSGSPATKWYVLRFRYSYTHLSRPRAGFVEGTEGLDELKALNFDALTGTVVTSLEGWQRFEWLPR